MNYRVNTFVFYYYMPNFVIYLKLKKKINRKCSSSKLPPTHTKSHTFNNNNNINSSLASSLCINYTTTKKRLIKVRKVQNISFSVFLLLLLLFDTTIYFSIMFLTTQLSHFVSSSVF